MTMNLSRALILLAVSLGAAACGGGGATQDKASIEKSIVDGLGKDGLALKSVTCPADVAGDKDGSWTCDATDEQGTAGKIKATKTGTNYAFAGESSLVDMSLAATAAEPLLTQQVGKPVTVKCPKKKLFAKKDVKFTCDATNGGAATKMNATLTDDTGKVNFKLEGADAAPADSAKPDDAKPADSAKPDDDKHDDDKHE